MPLFRVYPEGYDPVVAAGKWEDWKSYAYPDKWTPEETQTMRELEEQATIIECESLSHAHKQVGHRRWIMEISDISSPVRIYN
jgi:hypothetical protein